MNYTTTLKALRKNGACIDGYNRLVCHLKGDRDHERDNYIRFKYDEPIPLSTILDSNGLDDAIWALRAVEQSPEFLRDYQLFAVACAREVQHLMTDPRSVAALDVAERRANGTATDDDLAAARGAAWDAARDAAWSPARAAAWAAAWAVAWVVARYAARAKQAKLFTQFFCSES